MFEPASRSSVNFTFIKDKSKYDAIKGWTESGYANFDTETLETEPEEVTPYDDEDPSESGVDYGEQASETSSVKSDTPKRVTLKSMIFNKAKPVPKYKNLLQPEEFFS